MRYVRSIPFQGNLAKGFEATTIILTSNGFRIDAKSERSMHFTGPGMNSSRENPLVGASRVHIFEQDGELHLEAELGGVQRMGRFLLLLLVGLALLFVVTFGILFPERALYTTLLSVAPFLPWIVLLPLMVHWLKKRTAQALETLLINTASAGKSA